VSTTGWIKVPQRRCQDISRSSQGHPVSVRAERKVCSIIPPTISPMQGIFHRRGMRPGSLPAARLARKTRAVETTFYPRSCSFERPAVVGRFSLFLTRQRRVSVVFATDTSDLDRCKFRAQVRLDSSSVSRGAEVIRGVVVIARKAPVAHYYEGVRRSPTWHYALRQRVARTYGVSLRRQPDSGGYHQESHVPC
jgi:hypothetical protein